MDGNTNKRGELVSGEPHPAYFYALEYISSIPYGELLILRESFASCAIEGNRLGEVCAETLDRLINNLPISDRYIMGLGLAIMKIKGELVKPKI
jgi:hypothetical protein